MLSPQLGKPVSAVRQYRRVETAERLAPFRAQHFDAVKDAAQPDCVWPDGIGPRAFAQHAERIHGETPW